MQYWKITDKVLQTSREVLILRGEGFVILLRESWLPGRRWIQKMNLFRSRNEQHVLCTETEQSTTPSKCSVSVHAHGLNISRHDTKHWTIPRPYSYEPTMICAACTFKHRPTVSTIKSWSLINSEAHLPFVYVLTLETWIITTREDKPTQRM